MKAKLDADQTYETFNKTSNLINEAILRFTENGLEMTTADPSMVAMVDLEIPETSFEEYEVHSDKEEYEHLTEESEEGLLIGVNIDNLASIVKMFDEEITFTLDDDNHLVMTEEDDRFELPILNLSTDYIPSMDALDDHEIKAEITNNQFKTVIDKLSIATDSANFTLDNEGELTAEAGGNQISVESGFELGDVEVLDGESEETESLFALEYLDKAGKMFRSLETCDSLDMKLGENFPMELTHESNRENLKFVLAPRIEED